MVCQPWTEHVTLMDLIPQTVVGGERLLLAIDINNRTKLFLYDFSHQKE